MGLEEKRLNSEEEIKEDISKAIYELIWQTAHLYKDAPGGKLACPQRLLLERYVDTKIATFDFVLQKTNNRSELKEAIKGFLKDLEENFKASVHEQTEFLSYYQKTKRECLEAISKYVHLR